MRKILFVIFSIFIIFSIRQNNKTILVTGFETFSGDFNISEEILKTLPEKINGYKLVKVVLPVEWDKSNKVLEESVKQHNPSYIISLGENIGKNITYEEIATNQKNGLSDNIGEKEKYIGNYKEIKTTFNLNGLNKDHTIGKYICNSVYYHTLENFPEIPSVFIHIGKQVDIEEAKKQFIKEWSELIE